MNASQGSEPSSGNTPALRRTDARRNYERVVTAATEAFRELGTQASVPLIAERAQVGKATVYRSFPTKEDLVETITQLHLEEFEQRTATVAHEVDAGEAFRRYVIELFDTLAHDRLFTERLSETGSPAATSILTTLAGLMESARATGSVRDDATELDLRVILCGAALQLSRLEERDPAVWRRYGEMVLAAFGR